ncbi:MAG TPA: anion transporter [Oscillatoriaceae cyanobacterium M33_DOE_052]|uniref:Anion transporter n=1 Tax=Planktothricoides sp. SpSt-374 TaxID=2282167 RepID=A0A7C3ZTL3_9CYAN|nr:anion transporter [Oscillatoriaceae cyanobacterium M33_DOE_052]
MSNALYAAQVAVLALCYVGLGIGYFPGLRMNRATIVLAGVPVLITLGVLTLQEAWRAIDANTIVFLLSMMVINSYLSYAGFFNLSLLYLLRLTRSPLGLLALLTFGTGILSAFFLNDTLALVSTPMTLQLTRSLGLNPVPYLLAIAASTNIGSVATLSGNPQNILVGSFSKIPYLDFAQALTPIAIVGLVIQIGLLYWLYPEVRSTKPCPPPQFPRLRLHRPLLLKTMVVTTLLLIAFIINLPLAESAFLAAAALLVTRRIKPQRVLKNVDWSLLVMFSGLFILTYCVRSLQVLNIFAGWISSSLGLLTVTTILSNLISNVPTVLLLQGFIPQDSTQSWLLLAAGSTLAGNLTLFGAVANLITVEAAASEGSVISFWEHLRFGLPLTVVTLALTYSWIKWF